MEDASDILGGKLHVAQHGVNQSFAGLAFSDLLYFTLIAISLGLAVYILHPYYTELREKRYRKNLRRRHGIPDHDRRPFTVAFAAAKGAHLKRDSKESTPSTAYNVAPPVSQSTALQRHIPRQRQNGTAAQNGQQGNNEVIVVPSRGPTYVELRRMAGNPVAADEADHRLDIPSYVVPKGSIDRPRQPARRTTAYPKDQPEAPVSRSKHGLEDGEESEKETKKTRVDGDELIDGDEEAEWHGSDVEMEVVADPASPTPVVRGSKRTAEADSDEGFESSRGARRDKRARKNVKVKDAERGHASSTSGARGKKRDRAEARSVAATEGPVLDDEDDSQRAMRRRRVVSNPKAAKKAGGSRGRKRGREASSPDTDGSDSPSQRVARHKRGKRVIQAGETTDEDSGEVVVDPLCHGRAIGEEWQSGNVWYKVGPNGQRLRRANVKSRQPVFHMPKDSVHPDRNVGYEIYVQEWLTEEEYKLAKERQEVWEPELSRTTSLSDASGPSSPTKGKNLLYASASVKDVLAPSGRNHKQALIPVNGTRVNPVNGFPIRRLSTIQTIGPVDLGDANLRVTRTFSKWEKQEREALSLAHLSELAKKEEPAKKQTGALLPAASTLLLGNAPGPSHQPPKTLPTPAASSSAMSAKPNEANVIVPATAKPSSSDLPSLTIPAAPANAPEITKPSTVPFPSTSAASQVVEQSKPVLPSAAPAAPSPSPFSFAKPTTVQSSVPSTPAGSLFQPSSKPAEINSATTQPPATQQSTVASNFFARPPATVAPAVPPLAAPNPFASTVPTSSQASAAGSNQTTKSQSAFTFGTTPTSAPASAKIEPPAAPPATVPSLLSRLGAPTPANSSSTPSFGTAAPAVASVDKPAPVQFSFAPSATNPATSTSAQSSAGGAAPPPFSFNIGTTPAPPAAPTVARATESSKPSTMFSFAPPAPAPSSTSNTSSQPPKFTFGPSSSKPVTFGNLTGTQQPATGSSGSTSSPFAVPTNNNQTANATNGSIFGGSLAQASAPSSNTAGSAFAAPSAASAPKFTFGAGGAFSTPSKPNNPFGASTTPAGTPGASNVFGTQTPLPAPSFGGFGASTTPAGKPPATSMFGSNAAGGSSASGQGTTTPAGTPAQLKDSSKAVFSFTGSTTPAGPPPSTQPKFSFGINNASTTTGSTTGASSTPGFGSGQPTPSAFGFGAPSNPFTFGKPTNSDTTQK